MKSYVLIIKILDRKHSIEEPFYRTWTKFFNSYRELRDYLVKYSFYDHEYKVYEETDIKIKRQGKGICI